MSETNVEIGQIYTRNKDGRRVRVNAERDAGGLREVELVPLEGGRKSWKWDRLVLVDLTLEVSK